MPEYTVVDVMRTNVATVQRTDTVATVARLLADSGMPGIPVVDDGQIVGIVTEADLIERQADVDFPEPAAFFDAIVSFDVGRKLPDELRRVLGRTAADVMTHPVYNITSSATINQLATLMINEHVNPVPVLDDDHNLVGIVSRADFVRKLARLEGDSEMPAPRTE